MSTLTVKLPDELKASLDREAASRGIPRSELVREALQIHLQTHYKPLPGSVGDLARDLFGSVEGGPGDLSTNPKHMEGYGR